MWVVSTPPGAPCCVISGLLIHALIFVVHHQPTRQQYCHFLPHLLLPEFQFTKYSFRKSRHLRSHQHSACAKVALVCLSLVSNSARNRRKRKLVKWLYSSSTSSMEHLLWVSFRFSSSYFRLVQKGCIFNSLRQRCQLNKGF